MKNYMLLSILIMAFVFAGASSSFAEKVVSWQFDETSGLVATDSSGNGIDGTLGAGFTTGQWVIDGGVTGQPGDNALYMNGDPNTSVIATVADPDNYANGASNIFKGTASWTVNFWIKFDGTPALSSIGGFGDCEWDDGTVGNPDRHFASWDNTLEFELSGDGLWPGAELEGQGQWRMLTATYDSTTQMLKLYVDGDVVASGVKVLDDTEENAFKLNSGGWIVWANFENQVPLKAWVDDFVAWDEAKSDYWVKTKANGYDTSADLQADFNNDGIVDLEDFSVMAGSWMKDNWVGPRS